LQLACACGAEPGEQSLRRDRVLNEVHMSIEVEPERGRADLPHRHDRRQISLLAATDQRHEGAMTR
jgi:hypothetical protein